LRKRKWKILSIKNFVTKHVFGYQQTTSEEVTSSRAAENQIKTPSTKQHRQSDRDISDDDDDDNDDDDNDDDDQTFLGSWRKIGKSEKEKPTIKPANGQINEKTTEQEDKRTKERTTKRDHERAKNKMREELFGSKPEVGTIWKFISSLENLSLCASDLNVVVFCCLLPWLRQLWR